MQRAISRRLIPLTLFVIMIHSKSSIAGQQEQVKAQSEISQPAFHEDSALFCWLKLPATESKSRTLLMAFDGERLFVDLNSDRDLSEPSEAFKSRRDSTMSDRDFDFEIPEIRIDDRRHTSFRLVITPLENYKRRDEDAQISDVLKRDPKANSFILGIRIDGDSSRLAGSRDSEGVLQFADNIESAPTINFCGPKVLRISGDSRRTVRPGAEAELILNVGTTGDGPGTFAAIAYENFIPESVYPKAIISTTQANETPDLEISLKHRC